MWELVNPPHYVQMKANGVQQSSNVGHHVPANFHNLLTLSRQCVCTTVHRTGHEFTIACKHAEVTSAVPRLDSRNNPICSRTHSTTASSWAPSLPPSTQRKAPQGQQSQNVPQLSLSRSLYLLTCFNIIRTFQHQVLLNLLHFRDG